MVSHVKSWLPKDFDQLGFLSSGLPLSGALNWDALASGQAAQAGCVRPIPSREIFPRRETRLAHRLVFSCPLSGENDRPPSNPTGFPHF